MCLIKAPIPLAGSRMLPPLNPSLSNAL